MTAPPPGPHPPRRSVWRWVCGVYLALLHAAVIVLVLKTNFLLLAGKSLGIVPPEEWSIPLVQGMLALGERDAAADIDSIVLLGDSLIAQLDPLAIHTRAVNLGLGGDTTETLPARMGGLRAPGQARSVVIGIGVNDLKYRAPRTIAPNIARILGRIPPHIPVILLSVLPVDEAGPAARARPYLRNGAIQSMNAVLKAACDARSNCRYADAWPAFSTARPDGLYGGDGWHLSADGNRALSAVIRSALAMIDAQNPGAAPTIGHGPASAVPPNDATRLPQP